MSDFADNLIDNFSTASRNVQKARSTSNLELFSEAWNSLSGYIEELECRIAELEGDNDALKTENAELKERIGFLEINAIVYSSGQMGYIARIAELEAENKEYRLLIQDWIDIFDPQFTERLSFIDGVRLAMIEAVKESEE